MLLVFISLFVYANAEFDADCITPTGMASHCISIIECEKLKPLIHKSIDERESLKTWHCGFDGDVPQVCCPPSTPKSRCYTPKSVPGLCVKREACPSIVKMLKPPVSKANLDYVARSKCIGPDVLNVCCDEPARNPVRDEDQFKNGADNTVKPTAFVVTQNPLETTQFDFSFLGGETFDSQCKGDGIPEPNSGCCGIESSGGNRIFGGNATGIDQYPWLALIEYANKQWLCGGSLISRRFVLTAAHCLITGNKQPRDARFVRLGDYNITNDGADCVEVEGGGEDCNIGPVSMEIQLVKLHPDYNNMDDVVYANDIALIQLKESVKYTDFIRPICLPFTDMLTPPPSNLTLFVAGWGATSETRRTSEVKFHVDLPFYPQPRCDKRYSLMGKPIIWEKQICAGGEPNKDSCQGDSGGPLMRSNEKTLELIGVTSFGLRQCGNSERPSVYTKVHSYMGWIRKETELNLS